MMTSLFSIFDPSTQIMSLKLNWISILLALIMIPMMYWLTPTRSSSIFNLITLTLKKEFSVLLGPTTFAGSTMMILSLFLFILVNNSMGLFPYIFTATSHPMLTVTLALPLWVALMLYGWLNHTIHMLAHLVPQGTPPALTIFMVCIETISNLIRPLTLSVRLAANMIAGHLLMTLLGNQGPNSSTIIMPIIITTQIALITLESAVAMIQAYVFAVLTTLYVSETTYVHS
uniref:ATP synthase subunit a n=1 Tax=Tropostreptus sigmatospinus TaxID=2931685 RepID=A0A8T9JDX0_9MYRI|nr:ATP synthase F0 subunit 6 [Tropostreptus sigmatospinus]UOF70170.1 ATP synthase F0 subunit 6 [Tropostreptus sigmatospinus]